MKHIFKLISLGALALTTALPAWAEVTLTDLKGRTVTLADTPDRVLLGFYYEDFIAITGPGGIDKVVAISRAPWAEWRPMQWEAYKAVYPQIDTLPDVGDTETSTFSVEAAIAAKPDVALLAGSSMRLARVWRSLNPQASRLSWSITTPRRLRHIWPLPE